MTATVTAHDMPRTTTATVVGSALHLPGVDLPAVARTLIGPAACGVVAGPPACAPEHAADLLGRKGLLAKEPATRLALCAVHRALGLSPRAPRATGAPDPRTAVVVSSNLGNVGTVSDIARRLRAGGPREVGPMEAPNASSNVIAGAIAIRFGFGGPNLTVCSGAVAGLDALWLGGLLLRTGRADRVVVVGVEPDDPDARMLHAARRGRRADVALRAGAACLLLAGTGGPERALGWLGSVRTAVPPSDETSGGVVLPARAEPLDMVAALGDTYGAAGLVHTALALDLLAAMAPGGTARVRCGDSVDGVRELLVGGVECP